MAEGDTSTLAPEILRQHDETRRRMGGLEEELRNAVGAVELRADQRTMVCSNPVLTNSF